MRCLYWWVHLTTGLCDHSSHILGSKMSLPQSRVRLTFCTIGSQPKSQLASCNWPANQPCDKIPTCLIAGWSDSWWQEDRGLITLGPCAGSQHSHWFPLEEWPTWPRPGKWHKWALQPIICHWHYFQGSFAVVYVHHLITFSCMKCREMLYRLFLTRLIY